MTRAAGSFLSGLVFAMGLGISGMTNPNKVLNFLDFCGHWDPSLALVMLGAVGVNLILFPLILRRPHPLLDVKWYVPERKDVDLSLVIGAMVFGMGWGLAGFCPGPAITTLAFGKVKIFVFVVAMAAGGIFYHLLTRRSKN